MYLVKIDATHFELCKSSMNAQKNFTYFIKHKDGKSVLCVKVEDRGVEAFWKSQDENRQKRKQNNDVKSHSIRTEIEINCQDFLTGK